MEINFLAKKVVIGSSHGIIVPKSSAILLDKDKKYLITIKEAQNGENSEINLD